MSYATVCSSLLWSENVKDGIKVGLQETDCEIVDWICLVQDRVQWRVLENVEMNLAHSVKGSVLFD